MYERVATPLASGAGMGRIGALPAPMTRRQLAEHVKRALGLPHVLVVAPNQLGVAAGKTCMQSTTACRHGQRSTKSVPAAEPWWEWLWLAGSAGKQATAPLHILVVACLQQYPMYMIRHRDSMGYGVQRSPSCVEAKDVLSDVFCAARR